MEVKFIEPSVPSRGVWVVGALADKALTPAAKDADRMTGGAVTRALAAAGRFTGAREEVLHLPAPGGLEVSRLVVVGLGDPAKLTAAALERIGGSLFAAIDATGATAASLHLDGLSACPLDDATVAAALATGLRLRSYRFDKYKTRQKPDQAPALAAVDIATTSPSRARAAFEPTDRVIDGVFLARDLVSEPANTLYPVSFAERCLTLADSGLDVQVLSEGQLAELGMGALLGVGQGSARESRVVALTWRGIEEEGPPICLVGKGVTFDTGGISIKPAAGMEDMKWDMGGAAAVVGTMLALAGRKARAHVVGLIGLVENMPGGNAQRPGDVVTSMSGQTIEVINTDAEGRLVLADVLWHAQQAYKPRLIVDLATLTGAVIVALGQEYAGVYATEEELADRLAAASKATGEKLWRMPLDDAFDKEIDSLIADVKNVAANRWGGSIIGAQFLKRFVDAAVPWAHIDIAGVTWTTKGGPTTPKGGVGFGVRLLDRLVASYEG
ncbi:MAG: leucyl aminopeptidase [Rhodospirillaceae bacterium]|nr:leucyl aminopeptidase [Rhodospirillaceae bacterium]